MRYVKFIFFICVSLFTWGEALTQDCDITISGKVIDKTSQEPLSYVNVSTQESEQGAFTDDSGYFSLTGFCADHYHLIFTHIGCEPVMLHLDLVGDTILNVTLDHSSISLESITIEGQSSVHQNQASLSIGTQVIEDNLNKNLSNLLENQAGIAVIKNGSGISKPVVHGLYGNRLPILNNGIAQSGQQWGNDHSPEIDPLSADKITVVKGASALEYFGGNMGSLVLVEPKAIGREPHLHGRVNYAFETNGLGHNLNFRMERGLSQLGWRLNGTLKKYGDRQAPSYFLTNTGTQEANLSLQLEKSWNEKLFAEFYASTYNAELGILRGAHIGNLTDLEAALTRAEPFYTDSTFSYNIEPPRQAVSHHLVKLSADYFVTEDRFFQFIVAAQYNDRKEYDNRRSGRSEIPVLGLQQLTYTAKVNYNTILPAAWMIKTGLHSNFINNANQAGTGISPLIPDYFDMRGGWFTTLAKSWENTALNLGVNYMYEQQRVAYFDRNGSGLLIRDKNNFHTVNGIFGIEYQWDENQSLLFNSGLSMRPPAINELYSDGLHQGVSGIELGDTELVSEQALKSTLEYKLLNGTRFSFSALAYYQKFWNYIYLNPQDELRLTIRGAFPVFMYEQIAANIYGLDLSTQLTVTDYLVAELNYSYIGGRDTSADLPLIFIPSGKVYGALTFNIHSGLSVGKLKIEDFELELNNKYVFMQDAALAAQDFVAPPAGYNLMGLKLKSNILLPKNRLRYYVGIDNLMNVAYRDYLNRLRYFADETGFSLTMGINLKF